MNKEQKKATAPYDLETAAEREARGVPVPTTKAEPAPPAAETKGDWAPKSPQQWRKYVIGPGGRRREVDEDKP